MIKHLFSRFTLCTAICIALVVQPAFGCNSPSIPTADKMDKVTTELLEMHTQLNPLLWQDNKPKPEIQARAMQIGQYFFSQIDLADIKLVDIILVGSMASYEFTEGSDVDIQVLVSAKPGVYNEKLLIAYFLQLNKLLHQRKIEFYHYPLQVSIYPASYRPARGAVYSLMQKKWLTKTTPGKSQATKEELIASINAYIKTINEMVRAYESNPAKFSCDKFSALRQELKTMRYLGIERKGIFSKENLTYRALSRLNYLERLASYYEACLDRQMSLP